MFARNFCKILYVNLLPFKHRQITLDVFFVDEITRRLIQNPRSFAVQIQTHVHFLPRDDSRRDPHRFGRPVAGPRIARNHKQRFHVKLRNRSVDAMISLTVANPEKTALSSIAISRRCAL